MDDPNRGGWNPVSIVFRPHHNEITGNYDINVLIAALEQKGKTVVWHDKRNGVSSIDLDGTDDVEHKDEDRNSDDWIHKASDCNPRCRRH